MAHRASNFYIQELSSLPPERGLHFDHKGAWIRCPNPRHAGGMERSPSLKINVDPGKYQGSCYCFGCKEIKGGWNVLAKMLHLKKVTAGAKSENVGFSFKKFEAEEEVPNFDDMIPWSPNHDWRGIRADTLLKFDTKVLTFGQRIYLMFPVYVHGEAQGYVRANQKAPKRDHTGKKQRNYVNMKGDWVQSSLFGYDLARKRVAKLRKLGLPVVVWVVEGPRDTMNIAQHGGVVVGLIGSNVTQRKIELILELDPDIIISATDNDDAGNLAAEHLAHGKLREDEKTYEFKGVAGLLPVIRMKFSEGRDPADLTKQQVRKFNKRARARI